MASVDDQINQMDSSMLDEINKYIDEMKGEAQGDYNFIVKFLKRSHEIALGTNDQERAAFFEKVSDALEQRIGRIPYDYELYTSREKADIANYLKRQDILDTDQRKREKEFQDNLALTKKLETETTLNQSNASGMLGSGIQEKKLGQQEETRRMIANKTGREFQMEQIQRDEARKQGILESARRLEDLKTQARRGAIDQTFSFDRGMEGASLDLAKRLAAITRQGAAEKRSALTALQQKQLFEDSYA